MGRQGKGMAGSQTTRAGDSEDSLTGVRSSSLALAQVIPDSVRVKALTTFSGKLMAGAGGCLLDGYAASLIDQNHQWLLMPKEDKVQTLLSTFQNSF